MSAAARRLIPSDLASRAALLSLGASAGLMLFKLTAGLLTGSIAVLSDGVDSAQDVLAAAIALVSVQVGKRPPDTGHPYGHGRAETLAAGAQGLLILAGGAFIIVSAVRRLLDPPASIEAGPALLVMLLAAAVNLGVNRYATGVARATNSPAISSDARHLWTNVVQAGAILLGLALVLLTGETIFDAAVALLLGLYLLYAAGAILWAVAGDVLDRSLAPEDVRFIQDAIRSEPGVTGFHRLRTRRSGQVPHIDCHLILPPSLSLIESHDIAHRVEARIKQRWPAAAVTIHTEPALEAGAGSS
jgi:cation diffusion facilitator family transporter